jgi:sec-independent protein translocase protein TatA
MGTGEIILIAVVLLVIFGGSKLPQLGDGLGRAIGSFKRAISGANEIEATTKKSEPDGAAAAETDKSAKPSEKAP